MKRTFFLISILSLFNGWIVGDAHAQGPFSPLPVHDLSYLSAIYRMDTLVRKFAYLMPQFPDILASTLSMSHPAPDLPPVISFDSCEMQRLVASSDTYTGFSHTIRMRIVSYLLDRAFTGFITRPYRGVDMPIIEQSGDFKVLKLIEASDSLDDFLETKLSGFSANFDAIKSYTDYLDFNPMDISLDDIAQLSSVFLFKDDQDLKDIGYELISRKSRINKDRDYRRYNIMAAFHNIGNVRIIMPGETFSTLRELHYNPGQGEYIYMSGYATFGDSARLVYGGGLCGVATALYQGSLTNLGLALVEYRPHSIYYRNLYEAEINGITIKDPGLDATIYSPVFDLKLQNIRSYPIILVLAYDGGSGTPEQVFTISKAQDKGTFQYIGTYKKNSSTCFTRKINGIDKTNCYDKIKNF